MEVTREEMQKNLESQLRKAIAGRRWGMVALLAEQLAEVDPAAAEKFEGPAAARPDHTLKIAGRPGVSYVSVDELPALTDMVSIVPPLPESIVLFVGPDSGTVVSGKPRDIIDTILREHPEARRSETFWVGVHAVDAPHTGGTAPHYRIATAEFPVF